MEHLQNIGVHATGAIASNRLPLPSGTKEFVKDMPIGDFMFWKFENKNNRMLITAWMDKKLCYYITNSNDSSVIPKKESQRGKLYKKWLQSLNIENSGKMKIFKEDNELDEVEQLNEIMYITNTKGLVFAMSSCSESEEEVDGEIMDDEEEEEENEFPFMIEDYCNSMKGVDYLNQACSFYRMKHSSWKWYRSILIWLIELALNNSYKLYKHVFQDESCITLKYRMEIIKKLKSNNNQEELNLDSSNFDSSDLCKESSENESSEQRHQEVDTDSNEEQSEVFESEVASEKIEDDDIEYQFCLLGVAPKLHDCDVCSNRFKRGRRKRTYSVCLNINCKIEPTRRDYPRRYFRCCRECFDIHLDN